MELGRVRLPESTEWGQSRMASSVRQRSDLDSATNPKGLASGG